MSSDTEITRSNRPPVRWTALGGARPRHRGGPVVPPVLEARIRDALAAVDLARADLDAAVESRASLGHRRHVRARLRTAFDMADALLRQATTMARDADSPTWSSWRARLSRLDTARQRSLFAEMDDSGVLLPGSVRVVDYGMSGPDIGEPQLGSTRPPGTPARIGLEQTTMFGPVSSVPQPRYVQQPIPLRRVVARKWTRRERRERDKIA